MLRAGQGNKAGSEHMKAFPSRSNIRQLMVGDYFIVLEKSSAVEDLKPWRYVIYKDRPNMHHSNIVAGSDYVYRDAAAAFDASQARLEEIADVPEYDHPIGVSEGGNLIQAEQATLDISQELDERKRPTYRHDEWSAPSRMVHELGQLQTQGIPQEEAIKRLSDQPRMSWPQFFMALAEQYAAHSTCYSKVGAVLVDEVTHEILGAGFNGAPHGAAHCLDVGCQLEPHHTKPNDYMCVRCIHAEANAVMHALKGGMDRYNDAVLYTTRQPCLDCLKLLLQWGVTTIYYREPYEDARITTELKKRVVQRQIT